MGVPPRRSGERHNSPVSEERPDRSSRTVASRNPLLPKVNAPERSSCATRLRTARAARARRSGRLSLTSSHPAGELVHVEIVPPGADLAVTDLEGSHDLQLERLARELEDVHPLGHHDRPVGCDVDEAEVETLDAWRARADERRDVVRDGLPAGDRRQRDIVVDGVVREKCGPLGGPDIVRPRRAEPADYLDRALHLAPP